MILLKHSKKTRRVLSSTKSELMAYRDIKEIVGFVIKKQTKINLHITGNDPEKGEVKTGYYGN